MTALTTKAGVEPIDPNDPRTWVNIPSPVDLRPIQEEITKAGGINRFGEPNFIIVWGQEYKTWDCGKMRLHFDEELIDAKHTANRWACRPDVFERAVKWLEARQKERVDAYLNLNFNLANKFADVGKYLAETEDPNSYFKLPSDEEDLGRIARLMPEHWMYVNGLFDYEHIGQQCYWVLQYYPPEMFGSKEAWDDDRYASQYYPETDREETMLDINGPFPERGMYEMPVIRIGEKRTIEMKHDVVIGATIPREYYSYKEPTIANTVEPLRELLRIRDSLTDAEKDPIKRKEKREQDFLEERPKAMDRWRKAFRERFRDAKPVGGGNPTNISANKAKFD